jgi:hypothetical protein
MLALSNDSAASEGERDNVMRMAHATLAKYNLSLGDTEVQEEARIDSAIEISPHVWARTVAYGLAELYFCQYFFVKIRGTQRIKHYFVGRESNVITAQEMTVYVIKSISKEARRRTRELSENGKYERDFCKGASSAVWARCKEIRTTAEKADTATATTGTSMVLASLYWQEKDRNALVVAQKHGPLKASKGRQTSAGFDAHSAGRQLGSNINLNRQVGCGNSNSVVSGMLS